MYYRYEQTTHYKTGIQSAVKSYRSNMVDVPKKTKDKYLLVGSQVNACNTQVVA